MNIAPNLLRPRVSSSLSTVVDVERVAARALAALLRAPSSWCPRAACPGHLDAFIREDRERFSEGIVLGDTAAVAAPASVDELERLDGIGPQRLQDIKEQGLACAT